MTVRLRFMVGVTGALIEPVSSGDGGATGGGGGGGGGTPPGDGGVCITTGGDGTSDILPLGSGCCGGEGTRFCGGSGVFSFCGNGGGFFLPPKSLPRGSENKTVSLDTLLDLTGCIFGGACSPSRGGHD